MTTSSRMALMIFKWMLFESLENSNSEKPWAIFYLCLRSLFQACVCEALEQAVQKRTQNLPSEANFTLRVARLQVKDLLSNHPGPSHVPSISNTGWDGWVALSFWPCDTHLSTAVYDN